MFEFGARAIVSGLVVLLAGWLGRPPFAVALGVGLCLIASGAAFAWLEKQGKRNAGVAGIAASIDAALIATLLGAAGQLESLGFLVLAPIAYAVTRDGALPSAMAPIAVAALFGAHQVFDGKTPKPLFLIQAAVVLGIGLLMNQRRIVVTVTRDVIGKVDPLGEHLPDGYLELRESFRQLKDRYRDLEQRSRRDHLLAELLQIRFPNGERFSQRLCVELARLLQVPSVSLFGVARQESQLTVRAATGDWPEALRETTFTIDRRDSPARLRDRLEPTLLALGPGKGHVANIVLTLRGETRGLLCLRVDDPKRLHDAQREAEALAPWIVELLDEESRREQQQARRHRAELLYATAIVTQGAETPATLIARVLRELEQLHDFDLLDVAWFDEDPDWARALTFPRGRGMAAWQATGAPEIHAFDTREHPATTTPEMAKLRLGSFAAIPLLEGEAMLVAATRATGGVDAETVEELRWIAAELTRSLAELQGRIEPGDGLVTPVEFGQRLQAEAGFVVTLEAASRVAWEERFGKPAVDLALRQFARQIRAKLPSGGAACRRPSGDLVVFLPGILEMNAQAWTQEITAAAALIALRDAEGRTLPFGVRARVARVTASVG